MSRFDRRDRGFALPPSRRAAAREVTSELAFHLDMTVRDLMNRGMSESEARAEALRRFGDVARVDAACREYARQRDRRRSQAEYAAELWQDAAFAVRQLLRARGFALIAICTLALGIGATACVFSVLRAVVLRPLPFHDPDRVVTLSPVQRGVRVDAASGAELSAMRRLPGIFDQVAAYISGAGFTYVRAGEPVSVSAGELSSDYLGAVGTMPALGRGLLPADAQPGAPHVVLLGHRMWVRDFAGDRTVLGRTMRLSGETYQIVGVMPASFDIVRTGDDLFVPLQLSAADLDNFGDRYLDLVGRLRPGVTLARATAAATSAERALGRRFPSSADATDAMAVMSYEDGVVGVYRNRLLLLLGAVGVVLLIACVNVANLLLARGVSRSAELAIRAALGAGRARLVRQMLAESLVLSLIGAAIGVALAYGLVRGFVAMSPDGVPRIDQARIDVVVLAFTLGVAVVTSMFIGIVPALRTGRTGAGAILRDGGRWSSAGRGRDRVRAVLVGAEVALAMALLTGAGLLVRTAWSVAHVDPGFATDHLFAGRLLLPAASYPDSTSVVAAYARIDDAVRAVPGVRDAALTALMPLSNEGHLASAVDVEGSTRPGNDRPTADFRAVSPRLFSTLGVRLIDGRDFRRTDDASAPPVAIVSHALANVLWPGASRVVGRRIEALGFGTGRQTREVIGVADDVHDRALTAAVHPTIYIPYAQMPGALWPALQRSLVVVARTAADPHSLMRPIHRAIMSVDASLPFADAHTMDEFVRASEATARFNTILLASLSAIALVLATIGIYGVVSYFVSQRTREIGVRVALGALPRHVWRLVLGRGLVSIVGGTAVGTALSLAATRLLRDQLYHVQPSDPLTLAAVAALLAIVAVLATVVPARRAMRVAPVVALQGE